MTVLNDQIVSGHSNTGKGKGGSTYNVEGMSRKKNTEGMLGNL